MSQATKQQPQIRVGKQFRAWGSNWRVVERQRGRAGEERTMYVIERIGDGHREARGRSTLLSVI